MALRGGTATSDYRLNLSGFKQDVAYIRTEMRNLEQLANTAVFSPRAGGPGGPGQAPQVPTPRGGPSIPDLEAQQLKLSRANLQVASSQARAAAAEGDRAKGAAILRAALENAEVVDIRQGASIRAQIANYDNARTHAQQFGDAIKGSMLGIVGPAAAAGVAIGAVYSVANSFRTAFNFKVSLDATSAAIQTQVSTFRDWNVVSQEAQAYGARYKMTQSEINASMQASIPVMRMSNATVTELFDSISRLQTLAPEQPISEAARALRELATGDVTTIKEIFNVPAQDALRMKNEIQGGADAVKVLDSYLNSINIGTATMEAQTRGAMGAMKDLAIAEEELMMAQGEWAQGPGLQLLEARVNVTRGLTNAMQGNLVITKESIAATEDWFSKANMVAGALSGNWAAVDAARRQQAAAAEEANTAEVQLAGGLNAAAAAAAQAAQASAMHVGPMSAESAAAAEATAAMQALSLAMDEESEKAITNSFNAQTLTLRKAELQRQAIAAGNSMLASGQAGAGAAAQLANSSSLVDRLTAAYIRLRQAQMVQVMAKLDQTKITANEAEDDIRAQKMDVLNTAMDTRKAKAEEVRQAELRYQQALGNYGPAVERARNELKNLEVGSAAYIDKQTELHNLEQQLNQKSGGAAKSAAAGKLSTADKLGNDLYKNQIDYQNKLEDAADDHYDKVLDIERDYAKKSLEAQRASETSKRRSRLDFYLSLDDMQSSGDKRQQAIAVKASKDYEIAEQERAKLANEGKQRLANEWLALRQKQIQEEIDLSKQIAEAEADKDRERTTRLQALQQQQALLHQEEQKALTEGGDTDQVARDEALAAESQRYADAQDQIAESSGRAAEKKILNSQLSSKAVVDENAALERQKQLYDEIGAASGRSSAPTGAPGGPGSLPGLGDSVPTGAPTAPPDTASRQVATEGYQAFADAMQQLGGVLSASFGAVGTQITDAINAQSAMQAQKLDTVVKRLETVAEKVDAVAGAVRQINVTGGVG